MALYGISSLHPIFMLFVMTAVVLMQPPSAGATQDQPDCTCNRFYCSGISRQDYSEYFNTYDSRVNQENKVLDSIEAQTSYINLADKTANSDDNQVTFKTNNISLIVELVTPRWIFKVLHIHIAQYYVGILCFSNTQNLQRN